MIRLRRRVLLTVLAVGGLLGAPQLHVASDASDSTVGVREAQVIATDDAYVYTVDLTAKAVQDLSTGRTEVTCTATVRSTAVSMTTTDCYALAPATARKTPVPQVWSFGNTGIAQGTLWLSSTTAYKVCIRGLVHTGMVFSTGTFCAPLD